MNKALTRNNRLLDLKGHNYGILTVIEQASSVIIYNKRRTAWLCKCQCGIEKIIPTEYLRRKGRKSCGCLEHASEVQLKLTPMQRWFNAQKGRARQRTLGFDLTMEEFEILSTSDCVYCGIEPSQVFDLQRVGKKHIMKYNGIDRVDNTKGYIYNNCVSCCWTCNAMKLKLTLDEFKQKITIIYNRICK